MGQKKLLRFAEIGNFSNVYEYPLNMQGNWNKHFNNTHPIVLELACGKGEYALGLARIQPSKNFIGVDVKGNRIWKGATTALNEPLPNVAFLRTQIDKLAEYFNPGEVSEIWITFPDPQLRGSKMKKRLTHPKFLRLYQEILQPNGIVHLKTDSPNLYNFTREVIRLFGLTVLVDYDNIGPHLDAHPELKIKTHYEGLDIAKSNKIHYLRFIIDKPLPLEKDELLKTLCHEQVAD